ncbi:hypothetical protein [Streptomyces millisiae]|uniref:PKD domain-containing protein n=1 Tax=Streptomyces millisiae TaxID=3075542 RepID=A0ABU2LV43_9ACTN|nr:hypothetical protein [Streptomyces sp. DSM 44918]MDT0321449.1 hypothetical protein [Streptomyces sp. DSM 44918]
MLMRSALIVTLFLCMALYTWPAAADDGWGSVDCEQNPMPGCELGAESGEADRRPSVEGEAPRSPDGPGGSGGGPDEEEPAEHANPDLNLADCSYERSDYAPPTEASAASTSGRLVQGPSVVQATLLRAQRLPGVAAAPEPGPGEGDGAWYVYRCTEDGVRDALYRPPVWIADAPPSDGEESGPSPEQVAQRAREQLRLPVPQIAVSPAADQLVRVPTWLWLAEWGEVSATAAVPGVSVTATASPTSVSWDMGDGTELVCVGPGTPYEAGSDPARPSPDCGHTYTRPADEYVITVRVRWRVMWSGAGESGAFPGLTTQAALSVRVLESQALTTD